MQKGEQLADKAAQLLLPVLPRTGFVVGLPTSATRKQVKDASAVGLSARQQAVNGATMYRMSSPSVPF
jgi:hypothetical protein